MNGKTTPTCALCTKPADIEVWDGYWLCRDCRDRLGREALDPPEPS